VARPDSLDVCDVAIIGGGIVGVSAAYFLRRLGLDVVLVEQREIKQSL
jgi:glycine/D-amino acid oxidase-like deaminating enzyme